MGNSEVHCRPLTMVTVLSLTVVDKSLPSMQHVTSTTPVLPTVHTQSHIGRRCQPRFHFILVVCFLLRILRSCKSDLKSFFVSPALVRHATHRTSLIRHWLTISYAYWSSGCSWCQWRSRGWARLMVARGIYLQQPGCYSPPFLTSSPFRLSPSSSLLFSSRLFHFCPSPSPSLSSQVRPLLGRSGSL